MLPSSKLTCHSSMDAGRRPKTLRPVMKDHSSLTAIIVTKISVFLVPVPWAPIPTGPNSTSSGMHYKKATLNLENPKFYGCPLVCRKIPSLFSGMFTTNHSEKRVQNKGKFMPHSHYVQKPERSTELCLPA